MPCAESCDSYWVSSIGAIMGMSWGAVEGVRAGAGLPLKLKVNRMLNATGYRGGKLANGLGGLSEISLRIN